MLLFISSLTLIFLGLTSCEQTTTRLDRDSGVVLENSLDVFVGPQGVKPLVFLQAGGDKICRRGFPEEFIYGLDTDETRLAEDNTETTDNQGGETDTSDSELITTSVSENWFEMGLIIVNKHRSYYAIIEQLVFSISAPWGGETLSERVEIPSNYCETSPLYIVPPTSGSRSNAFSGNLYEPLKKNYVNNMTLYVSGVPIPTGPPKQLEEESGSDTLSNIRATADDAAGSGAVTSPQQSEENFILTYLPTYRVQLLLYGYWVDKSRTRKANLTKKINFTLSSQFLD